MSRRALSRSLVLLGILVLATTGCNRRETPVTEGIRSQTLIVGNLAEPKDLDPHSLTAYTDMNVAAALFEGLVVLDEQTCQPLPGVAESWEISPDGLVYTFHLRANAKWSNGLPVTAGDFAYSFHRILTPAFASEYAYMLWPIKNAEAFNTGKLADFSAVGVAAPDATTLRLTLERPTPYLLLLAAHSTWYPVPRATIEKFGRTETQGTAWTRPGNLVSNGPFMLAEWNPNARITVQKNAAYWDAAHVRLNRIRFLPIESSDVEERNFRAGQCHVTYDLPYAKIAGYRRDHAAEVRNDPFLNTLYVNFNVTKPPFADAQVRQALSLAIDREALGKTVLQGIWPAAYAFVPPGSGSYTSQHRVRPDAEAARRLLAAAGFAGGRGFPPVVLQTLNDARQPKLAEAIQAMWQRELGITVSIEMNEQKVWLQNQQAKQHQVALLAWTADYPDPLTFLSLGLTGNGNNWSGWSSADYDQLLERASLTPDPATRFALLNQAEDLLLREAPVAPLLYPTRTYLIHPAVRNWDPALIGIHLYKKVYLQGP